MALLLAAGLVADAQSSDLVRQLNDSFAAVYERAAPAVVVIEVESAAGAVASRLPRGLDFFFRAPDGSRMQESTEQGSGFIIRPDGYILTNNHVVENGEAGSITVTLNDGRKFPAELVGRDDVADIAVLKINGTQLPTLELGDSDAAKVGQFVFAIGAPFELPYTFTVGVISAKGRSGLTGMTPFYEEFIQTDASINPGNSGGPLCDLDGRVVGVNTLISGVNRGLGFAVPVNIARDVAEQLIDKGRVSRPWLGIGIVGLSENKRVQAMFPGVGDGVLVESIEANAPAYRSNLRPGDVILEVDGRPVDKASDLQREILRKQVGQDVALNVWRRGRVVEVRVRTGEQPSTLMRASSLGTPAQPPAPPALVPVPRAPAAPAPPPSEQGLVLNQAPGGALVEQVVPGSPAEVAGVRAGDVIVEAGGSPVRSPADVSAMLKQSGAADGVMLLVEREGEKTFAILKP